MYSRKDEIGGTYYDEDGAAFRQTVAGARQQFAMMHNAARLAESNCDGCYWLNRRYQKCSCCRRNQNMKDNYKEG